MASHIIIKISPFVERMSKTTFFGGKKMVAFYEYDLCVYVASSVSIHSQWLASSCFFLFYTLTQNP